MDYDANEALARLAESREHTRKMLEQAKREEAVYEARMKAAEDRAARWVIVGVVVIVVACATIYVWAA